MANNLSTRNIKLLGFAGLGILTVGGVVLGVVPLVGQLGGSNEDIDQARSQTTDLQGQINTLRAAQGNEAQITEFKQQFVEKFPETAQVPDLINAISTAAVGAGIPASDISNYGFQAPAVGSASGTAAAAGTAGTASGTAGTTPSTAPSTGASTTPSTGTSASSGTGTGTVAGAGTTGQAAEMTVNLTISGTTRKFATFLRNITSMDRNFTVTTFAVAGGAQGSQDTLTLTGKTYLYSHITTPQEAANGTTGSTANGTAGSTANGSTGTAVNGTTGTTSTTPSPSGAAN